MFGDEIAALQERPDGVAVEFKLGSERRYDLVVGADGLHSGVRRLAFGPEEPFEHHLGYAVAAFEVEGYRPRDEDAYMMYCRPGRMVGRFTMRDQRTLFLLIFADESAALPATLEQQKAMLRERYGGARWECPEILDRLDRAEALYLDRISQIRMPTWSRGRVALVGDAAFCVSLAAGQGSALAMISAYVLAGELADANGRHDEAFSKYEARLRAYVELKQRGAQRFAAALAPRTALGLWFRNQVMSAFALPGLPKFAVGRELVDALQLPDYSWPRLRELAA
ncbi:MAG TPA: FAD-dependent monooxygenase [Caulobacteraceae bacterium]|nr:FAD-dependent monooxygenase [Caulobacteraceae bacterium]